jgi:hypothetical protein
VPTQSVSESGSDDVGKLLPCLRRPDTTARRGPGPSSQTNAVSSLHSQSRSNLWGGFGMFR